MRTLVATLAVAVTLLAATFGTASSAEAGYYRYVYKVQCANVVKQTYWGLRVFRVCG